MNTLKLTCLILDPHSGISCPKFKPSLFVLQIGFF